MISSATGTQIVLLRSCVSVMYEPELNHSPCAPPWLMLVEIEMELDREKSTPETLLTPRLDTSISNLPSNLAPVTYARGSQCPNTVT
jgi:hypothetical protein